MLGGDSGIRVVNFQTIPPKFFSKVVKKMFMRGFYVACLEKKGAYSSKKKGGR